MGLGILIGILVTCLLFGLFCIINKFFISPDESKQGVSTEFENNGVVINNIKEDDSKDYVYDADYVPEYGSFSSLPDKALIYEDGSTSNCVYDVFKTEYIKNGYQYFKDLKVPYINIKGAQSINKILETLYLKYIDSYAQNFRDTPTYGLDFPTTTILTYYTFEYNNVLSIVVYGAYQTAAMEINYLTYNYDLSTGKLLSNNGHIEKSGFTNIDEKVKNGITDFAKEQCEDSFNLNDGRYNIVDYNYDVYQKDKNNISMYIDNDGKLNFILFYEVGAEKTEANLVRISD